MNLRDKVTIISDDLEIDAILVESVFYDMKHLYLYFDLPFQKSTFFLLFLYFYSAKADKRVNIFKKILKLVLYLCGGEKSLKTILRRD